MRTVRSASMYTCAGLVLAVVLFLVAGCPVNDTIKKTETANTAVQLPVVDNSELIAEALNDPDWPADGTVKTYA